MNPEVSQIPIWKRGYKREVNEEAGGLKYKQEEISVDPLSMDFSMDLDELDASHVGNLDEYDEASSMKTTYCYQMTREEYEAQAATETHKALQALIVKLEKDPSTYFHVLEKRKQEEADNAGMLAYLKSRMMMMIQGNKYRGCQVSQEECQEQLDAMKTGMRKVFKYSQEAKGRRMSKRIAARSEMKRLQDASTTPLKQLLPPPPPPPAPPLATINGQQRAPPGCAVVNPLVHSLAEKRDALKTPRLTRKAAQVINHMKKAESTHSLASVHSEMVSSNQLSRLKATKLPRSPGGTPIRSRSRPNHQFTSTPNLNSDLNSSEPLTQVFLRIMEQKFRNIRSPSPSSAMNSPSNSSIAYSPGEFSP